MYITESDEVEPVGKSYLPLVTGPRLFKLLPPNRDSDKRSGTPIFLIYKFMPSVNSLVT